MVGKEIYEYKQNLLKIYELIKNKNFFRSKKELENIKFRRSIFSFKDIKKGEKFSHENIKVVRPSDGLDPKFYEKLIGKKSKFSIKKKLPFKNKTFIK